MIRMIVAAIYLVVFLLSTIPGLIRVKRWHRLRKFAERDHYTNNLAVRFGRTFIGITGSEVKVSGTEHIPADGAVLFVCNHQSLFDILLMLGFIPKPKGFIAKKELQKFPIVSTWMQFMPSFFIDRQNIRQSLLAINQGVDALKSGYSLVIFPEGHRSRDGKIHDFKPGSLKLAVKSGVPIVPVTINGSRRILGSQGWGLKRVELKLTVSPPLFAEEYREMGINELSAKVHDAIAANL